MNSIVEIREEDILKAYKNASNEQKELLEHLFGSEVFKPADVRVRIKTFADAAKAVGIENPEEWEEQYSNLEPDVLAYFKLRIITKALNEGWEPKFVPGEYRWTPYFLLDINKMNAETKARMAYRSHNVAFAYSGVSYAKTNNGYAYVGMRIGSRLAFKSEGLAEYAGKQFTEIFADLILKAEE